jgi:bla regulator protein BlaR1
MKGRLGTSLRRTRDCGMKGVFLGTALLNLAAVGALAQPSAKPLTFEVASVKRSSPDARGATIDFLPGGELRVVGATLKTLITTAYDVRGFQVTGGPGWMDSARFDIDARSETLDSVTLGAQARERLRNLLASRFQLATRRETKEQQVYTLVVAKGGSKFPESKESKSMMRGGRGLIISQHVETAMLTTWMSGQLGRPVIDKTALAGKYDFELKWTPDPGQSADGPFGPLPPPPDPNGPSIFTAVQEQLGLRLESQKGPVEILVIDRAEKPSEN